MSRELVGSNGNRVYRRLKEELKDLERYGVRCYALEKTVEVSEILIDSYQE